MYSGADVSTFGNSAFGVVGDVVSPGSGHSKADLNETSETAV